MPLFAVAFIGTGCAQEPAKPAQSAKPATQASAAAGPAKVFMTKDISPAGLMKVYKALGREPRGNRIAIKLTVGEPGNPNHLQPALIRDLVQSVNGTFIDSNTAYGGKRDKTEGHMKAAKDHGFTAVAKMDVLDSEGEFDLPIAGGTHLTYVPVGAHLKNYDFMIVLSHFKGHIMGGFGGALKNIGIGIPSSAGKSWVHTAGRSKNNPFGEKNTQDEFIESMAEAAAGIIQMYTPEKMLYISVLNNMSVDCDCASNPAAVEMGDIGILASLDPVALDRASVDLIINSDDPHSGALKERIMTRKGLLILTHAEKLGIGSQTYELISLDD